MPDLSSAPLTPKSGPRATTLFVTLPPDRTGIRAFNAYDDPAMWWQRYREFTLGAIGTGVAVGDYDSDGRPDVFVVCKTGPNHLFRNLGDFRFEDVTERAGVAGPPATEAGGSAWKQGAALADVNNDGRLDLYVCRFDAPNLLYVNQGDGTFREEAVARGLALKDASSMAAFCDYDRDGWLDVYVQTNVLDTERRPNGQRDQLFRNNRDGTFANVTKTAGLEGETQGHSATWWDFDEDGWPDVYVANDFKDPDQLYRNNRDGTFTNVLSFVVPHTPHSSMGADLGDVNNDGHLDLLVADMAATSRYKDHRGMAKLRSGLPENEQRPKAAPQYMRNALFLGTGAGRMLEAAFLTGLDATDWTWSVRLEDLDNDGRLDAHFTNGMVRELHGVDLLQRAMAFESGNERIKLMKAAPPLSEQNLVFRNLGDLRFENASASWGLDHPGIGLGAAFGDLDGDGDLDLVVVNYEGEPTVCRNDSDSGNAVILDLRGVASNRFGLGATVRAETTAGTQVRTLTLARGYLSTSEPAVHFGLGDAATIKSLRIEWPSGRTQTFTDLAANRRYLIREPATASETAAPTPPATPLFTEISQKTQLNLLNRERPLNQLSREQALPFRLNRPGPPAAFADLDGDGQDDLVVGGVAGEAGQLLSNLGDGQFLVYGSSVFSEAAAAADGPILALDIDADGDLDLLVTKAGTAAAAGAAIFQPRILLNDGRGRFSPAPATAELIPPLPISVGAAVAADFEHTGRPGIFIGGRVVPGDFPKPPRSALLASREGRFVDVTAEVAPALATRGMVTAALWSDVDGDGWSDLLIAYDWGPVTCYRNVGGKKFEDISGKLGFSSAGTGWWRSLAAADFNGDGRPDFAVGNTGLNTRYRTSESSVAAVYDRRTNGAAGSDGGHRPPLQSEQNTPVLLYANVAFDGAAPQLVEAQAEGGKYYPLSSREPLLKLFPALARRFPTAESYAKATLDDVFPAEVLAAAAKLAVTELRSGVLLSQPDDTYRFAPLPRLAQLAPIHGIVAGDFDGDGRSDLMAIGNSYAPPPEPGRFDGAVGWFLRGDGRGGFTGVLPGESGFMVPGDARSLLVSDLNQDGWPDVLATRNNDRALLFQARAPAGRNSFGVALRGTAGNPAAIGARLTLTLADGSTQTMEVAAGSGYFAQSSATTFFGYSETAGPARLKIRWPDGGESEQMFAAPPSKLLRISAP